MQQHQMLPHFLPRPIALDDCRRTRSGHFRKVRPRSASQRCGQPA